MTKPISRFQLMIKKDNLWFSLTPEKQQTEFRMVETNEKTVI